jgi:hypothetical protein
MKATVLGKRTRLVLGLMGVALALMTFAPTSHTAPPQKSEAKTTAKERLTYASVVSYFKKAGLRATEVQKRCTILFEGEWKNANDYDYCMIIVEGSDEDIQVTFYLTDAHEMNWITEFLDSPFFTGAEKQQLFDLLNKHRESVQQRIGRYAVEFHYFEAKHAQIIIFSFTPRR